MAEIFCNIDNTGVTNGTSFATGFTDLRDAWNGATVGDTIFIGSGSTAYELSGGNVYASNDDLSISTSNPTDHIPTKFIGISGGDTGSIPMGDDRPLILCNRTNGTSVIFPYGCEVENLRFDGEMYTGNNSPVAHLQAHICTLRNIEVKVRDRTDGALIGDRAMGLSTSGNTNLIGCSLISDLSSSSFPTRDAGYESVNQIYESNVYDCVFHSKGNAPILSFNRVRASYGNGGQYHNCIFIGSGNETLYTPTGTCHTQSMNAMLAKGCIFYNLSSAVKLNHIPVSTTSSWNTELEMQNRIDTLRIHECMFINCNIAAETPSYSDPTGWESGLFTMEHVFRLHKCAFYNNTVSNTSGDLSNITPIQLSVDPFVDSANFDFRLNDDPNGGGKLKENDVTFASNSKIQARLYGASSLFRGQYDFSPTTSNDLSLGTGDVGDVVDVSGRSFQKISQNPIVWRRYSSVVAADSTGNFVPSDISGLAGWWDANDSDTLTLDSTSVTQWDDKSGNSRHVSQSTSGNKPTYSASRQINGINVLDFDGSNDLLSLSSAYISNDGISAVAVFIADDVSGGSNIYEGKNVIASWVSGNGNDFSLGVRDSNLSVYAENTGGGREAQGGSVSVDTGIIAFGESNSTHTKSGVNGNTPVSTTASRADLRFTGFGKDTSGGSIYFNGAIAEIIVYDVTSVSTEERQKLEGYLAHKWDLTGNLPSDHPYKIYGP